MKMLICFNGTPPSLYALEYGQWLAAQTQLPIHLLGIIEDAPMADIVSDAVDRVRRSGAAEGLTFTSEIVGGRAESVIAARALQEEVLVVVGKLDRPLWHRLLRGRSIRDLLASVIDPMIYIPSAVRAPALHQVLLCTTGIASISDLVAALLPYSRLGGKRMTILYVIPPISYDYPLMDVAHVDGWRDLQASNSLVARNIQSALEDLATEGIDCVVRVRHGYPAQEILKEMREGDYDLVGLGSHYSVTTLRSRFTANVTSEVAEQASRPLLIVRSQLP